MIRKECTVLPREYQIIEHAKVIKTTWKHNVWYW